MTAREGSSTNLQKLIPNGTIALFSGALSVELFYDWFIWIKFFVTFQHALILYVRRLFLKQYICLSTYQVVYSNITILCFSHQMVEELNNQEILKYCILSRKIFNNKYNCNCNLIMCNVQQTTPWSLHRDLNRSNGIKNKYTLKSWQVSSLNSETNNSITNVKNVENVGCQCEDIKQYLRNKHLLPINVFVYRK